MPLLPHRRCHAGEHEQGPYGCNLTCKLDQKTTYLHVESGRGDFERKVASGGIVDVYAVISGASALDSTFAQYARAYGNHLDDVNSS